MKFPWSRHPAGVALPESSRIVIEVVQEGEPPNEAYRYDILHPKGVTQAQTAAVLRVVARRLDASPARDRADIDLSAWRERTPDVP